MRALVVAALAGAVVITAPATRAADDSRVPFALIDNRPFVTVLVNGRPFSFVVDTGGVNALSSGTAHELGLAVASGAPVGGANAAALPSGTAAVRELRVGPVTIRGRRFTVADFSALAAHIGFRRFDGIIGYDTLRGHRVTFDYAASEIVFDAPAASRAQRLPMRMWGNIPVIDADVDGVRAELLVDTGDRSSVTLFTPFADAHYPRAQRALHDVVTGFGLTAPIVADVGRLRALALGGATVPAPLVRFATQRAGGFASGDFAGSIGGAVLRRFRPTFDYVRGTLELEAIANPPPTAYDRSGTWLSRDTANAHGAAGLRVDDVVPGGPAAQAGVLPGDRIAAVDGTPSDTIDLPSFRARLSSPNTAGVRFSIARPDGPVEAVVVLRDLV